MAAGVSEIAGSAAAALEADEIEVQP